MINFTVDKVRGNTFKVMVSATEVTRVRARVSPRLQRLA